METENVNEATERWIDIFSSTANRHAPIKEGIKNIKRKYIPWFTSELKEMIEEKNRRLKLYWMDGFLSDLNIVKEISNKITHLKRKLKKIFYHDKISKFEGDPKKMWNILKEVTNTTVTKSNVEPEFLDQKKANTFNTFFATVGTKIQEKLNIEEKKFEQIVPEKFEFQEETEEKITKLIQRIRNDVAVGYDDISAKLLKDSKETISETLTKLVNISYRKSTFPQCLKKGIVRAVHKKDDPEDPANYRPLTILSTLSKIFERSAADQQMQYYMKYHIINETQHAYMKGHSTETCLNEIVNYIFKENDSGNLVGIASLDLSKAFDSISHSHLIQKLSNLGLGKNSLSWCKSYLTNRKQQTKFKKYLSEEVTVTSGVPQGSIMGPILFISFINDLPQNFKNCKIVSYADDTQILVSAKSGKQIRTQLENLIKNAKKWYTENSLLNNASKTEIMLISGRKHEESFYIEIKEDEKIKKLELKNHIKILGVYLDQHLNWKKQVQEVNKKAKFAARNLQRINQLIPIKSRILLYNSLVATHFNYADTVWAGCNVEEHNKLQRTQNIAIKSILGMKKHDSATVALKKAKLLPLNDKRKIHQAVYVHKALDNKLSAPVCRTYEEQKSKTANRSSEKQTLGCPAHKTERYKRSPLYTSITAWNSIPIQLKEIKNTSTFKKNYQQHLQQIFKM